jgi:hypothetical protein
MKIRSRKRKLYLAKSSGELAASKISSGSGGERDPITELIQSNVLLNVFSKLNPESERIKIKI